MAVKLIADEVKAQMWDRMRPAVAEAANLFLRMGVKPDKGQSKKDALVQVMMDLLKETYEGGLEQGYEMSKFVYAGADVVAISDGELEGFRLAQTILEGVLKSMPADKHALRAHGVVSELIRVRGREADKEAANG